MLILPILALSAVLVAGRPQSADLRHVNLLTFHKGQKTNARRVKPIPQITCIGDVCGTRDEPAVVNCQNVGLDDRGIISWKCSADVPGNVVMSNVDVNCEGFDAADDDRVLVGSCGLTYSLNYKGHGGSSDARRAGSRRYYDGNFAASKNGRSSFGWLVFFLAVAGILSMFLVSRNNKNHGRTTAAPTRGWWGSWGGPEVQQGQPLHGGWGSGGSGSSWLRPGFWSGLLGGGALGYQFGRRRGATASDEHMAPGAGGMFRTTESQSPPRRMAEAVGGTTLRGAGARSPDTPRDRDRDSPIRANRDSARATAFGGTSGR